jgi:serine/threonine-protein kinase
MIGQTVGHYRILEVLGRGGMGVVYKAEDTRLGRLVALKFLPEELARDPEAVERFAREARAASALNHPHICTIYEVGEDQGRVYLAMEYIAGEPLDQRVRGGSLPAEVVIRWGAQIADGVAHAHERGLLHRDLKSANVIITADGRAKVLDFGLAQPLAEADLKQVTRSRVAPSEAGTLAGTVAYMAPEILRGERADPPSDIWGLGVLLYEMAVGTPPFRGQTSFALTSAILTEPPPSLPSGIPAALAAIIERCLAKDSTQRYQQAGEVRAALEAVQSGLVPAVAARPRRRAGRAIRSLAVLPFENAAADAETEYLSDGITESLINNLAHLPRLRVMARSTVFRYKGQRVDPQAVGRALSVEAVLTGRLFPRGQSLQITAELVDVADGSHLWGEQYNRPLADIPAVEAGIAQEISGKLRLRLTGPERRQLGKRYTKSSRAYQLYLQGRYHWNKRTEDGLKKAIEYFRQAIQADPRYALAYSGLSDSYYLLAGTAYGALSPKQAMPQAKAAAKKALALDPELAEPHASLASVLESQWDWRGAEKEFKRALALNPSYATARQWYAYHLTTLGRLKEAVAEAKRAQELDPLSLIINRDLGLVLYYARRMDEAIEQHLKTLELDPNFALAHQSLGRVYLAKGMKAEAVAAIEKAVSLAGQSVAMLSALAHVYGVTGQTARARKILSELLERSRRSYVPPPSLAVVYIGLGEKERALDWLEKASVERGLLTLKVHPVFDPLRAEPRFRSLLRRMKLPE